GTPYPRADDRREGTEERLHCRRRDDEGPRDFGGTASGDDGPVASKRDRRRSRRRAVVGDSALSGGLLRRDEGKREGRAPWPQVRHPLRRRQNRGELRAGAASRLGQDGAKEIGKTERAVPRFLRAKWRGVSRRARVPLPL